MPITTKPQLATLADGARLVDIAHAARIVGDVVTNAKVISNNKTFDDYELKAALKGESPAVKAAAMAAYNSAKNDATAKGKLVTRFDVSKKLDQALAAAKKADKDQDGELSEKELGKLQNWTPLRLAVAAVELKDLPTGKMATADFLEAANAIMRGVTVISEGDSPLIAFATAKTSQGITPDNILKTFKATLDKEYADYTLDNGLVAEVSTSAKAKKMLSDSAKPDADADDPIEAQVDADAYASLKKLFAANLTDVRFVRIGPANADGTLGVDRGMYVEGYVGKTADGKLAGMYWTSAET